MGILSNQTKKPADVANIHPCMTKSSSPEILDVSVVVCTRNRGKNAVHTIQTILDNQYSNFEVILIDQSTNGETAAAIEQFSTDSRFRYIRSNTVGTGISRNIGLAQSNGKIVIYTDDDCSVPNNWIQLMAEIFDNEQIGMVFCNVLPAPYDESAGWIPIYVIEKDFVAISIADKCQVRGMGAGMAVRHEAAQDIGGFDNMLGPGAPFPSCEDWDMATRMILSGWHVCDTNRVAVIHDGFRTWNQGKKLAKRNWIAAGAACAKPIKLGKWQFMAVIWHEGFIETFWNTFARIFRGKKPQGFRNFLYFWYGFFLGLRVPVDPQRIVFVKK
jgi:glycosyltransferase involved in cell wall biosynthesis